ncbi:hypothetical protein [Pseudomonas putida]|uniref:hypothetical protein n=1 Tax=Pseudomonas putida TaxID=303 RepID=UPI00381A3DBE
MKRMSTLNQIGAGILAGFGISFVVGYIVFQAEIFRQGAESIGVSFWGFAYFFGGLLTSIILWAASKRAYHGKWLLLFFVTIVAVGSIGLNNMIADPYETNAMDLQRNMAAMAQHVAQILFYGVPAALVLFYGSGLQSTSKV